MNDNQAAIDQHAEIANLYESCFIETIRELAEAKNFKKGDFAKQVWPESSDKVARNRWERMRTEDGRTGKPVACSLSDAYRMASVLGLQMSYVTVQAEFKAKRLIEDMDRARDDSPKNKKIP